MQVTINWDVPEIICGDESVDDPKYKNFVCQTIEKFSKIKPKYINLYQRHSKIENDSIYIGCNINSIPNKIFNSQTRILSSPWSSIAEVEFNVKRFPFGNFSLVMDYFGSEIVLFSHYYDYNSIAMQDIFSVYYNFLNTNKKDKKIHSTLNKFQLLLKIIFSAPSKIYKNHIPQSASIDEIMKEIEKIHFGSDPEFSLIENGKSGFVNAFSVVKAQKDYIIGSDGHNNILELRPKCSNDIEKFLENIDNLVLETSDFIDDDKYELITGGGSFENEPLGGHIHFSNLNPTQELLSMLDTFVGIPLKNCEGSKRPRGGERYDRLSEFRLQKYDNDTKGFEYRTPPSFFINEKLTKSVYIIAALVAKTFVYYKKSAKSLSYNSDVNYDNYKILLDFDKYKDFIDYFWHYTQSKSTLTGKVFMNWNISKKKKNKSIEVQISKTEDKLFNELDFPKMYNLYLPPFKSITLYGISDKTINIPVINIDSYYINRNVNLSYLFKYIKDIIPDISIFDLTLSDERAKDFIKNNNLCIGISLSLREKLLKNMSSDGRKEFLRVFLKKLSHFVRLSIDEIDKSLFENDFEIQEFESIVSFINSIKNKE